MLMLAECHPHQGCFVPLVSTRFENQRLKKLG